MNEETKGGKLTGFFAVLLASFLTIQGAKLLVHHYYATVYPTLSQAQKFEIVKESQMTNWEFLKYDWQKFKAEEGWK
ncbi:hypothetical protein [Sulfurospirillum sp. 1612]|uniref:hypothetical protein n=1 Tax=Sulfurospirillum sp. 1612 TaxID=3094835 RepID=UPI002F91E81A